AHHTCTGPEELLELIGPHGHPRGGGQRARAHGRDELGVVAPYDPCSVIPAGGWRPPHIVQGVTVHQGTAAHVRHRVPVDHQLDAERAVDVHHEGAGATCSAATSTHGGRCGIFLLAAKGQCGEYEGGGDELPHGVRDTARYAAAPAQRGMGGASAPASFRDISVRSLSKSARRASGTGSVLGNSSRRWSTCTP